MNDRLLATLVALKADPAIVVELYEQLFRARYWVLVADGEASLEQMSFLNYQGADGIQELPIFTAPNRQLIHKFDNASPLPIVVEIDGPGLWQRLLSVLKDTNTQVAVDAGEAHGIRLTRSMVIGMLNKYGGAIQSL